jgi:SHS2 domain-containing protein
VLPLRTSYRGSILVSHHIRKKYKFFEHTADAKFQAFGRSLEEAFTNAAYATVSLMWDREKIEAKVQFPVKVQGSDLEQLLVNFLEEILYLLDSRMFLLQEVGKVKIQRDTDLYKLEGLFIGDYSGKDYVPFGDVKAITYDELKIHSNDLFVVQVVVDV